MYENYRIYGPYIAKDGRLRIMGIDSNNVKHTISYPKYLMELHLGRYLEKNEQVDHIDGNPLNNDISNLRVVLLGEHQSLHAIRNKDVIVNCTFCNKPFSIKGSKINYRNRYNSGYFCSKQCSGKYGRMLQLKRIDKTVKPKVLVSKYKVKSAQNESSEVEAG